VARFYSNENTALQVVTELRRLGHDVLTSLDRTRAIHRHRTDDHAGMVFCTFDPDFRGQAERIDAAVAGVPDTSKQLIRVNRPG